jgi:excinuclease ABC subunit A
MIADSKDSHTAPFLKEALASSPHAERSKYDPHEAAAEKAGDIPLEQVGRDVAMPWESDGEKWHTVDRLSHNGKPCHWEGAILTWLDREIHRLGEFSETNWKNQTIVEIAGPKKSQGWFFHAHTAHEWVVGLVFRVGRNTFKAVDLALRLCLPPLSELEGVQVYDDRPRVRVANRKGPWQEVGIVVHRLSEIDTPAFRDFLKEAVTAFGSHLQRMNTRPEDVMPWKVNGERWHLGDKGFPPGKKVEWKRSVLTRLLELVRSIEPEMEVSWDARAAITLRLPGITRGWAQFRTKETHGLDCRFVGKKGQFNLSQVEKFGLRPEITPQSEGECLRLLFQHEEHIHAASLKELLAEHMRGFREQFGKA